MVIEHHVYDDYMMIIYVYLNNIMYKYICMPVISHFLIDNMEDYFRPGTSQYFLNISVFRRKAKSGPSCTCGQCRIWSTCASSAPCDPKLHCPSMVILNKKAKRVATVQNCCISKKTHIRLTRFTWMFVNLHEPITHLYILNLRGSTEVLFINVN